MMLAPFSEQKINVKNPNLKGMTFTTINDYGGRVQQVAE
jgi:P pilus assembly chaperone PapD